MAKKTPIERFQAAAEEILKEYEEGVGDRMGEVIQKVMKEGTKAVKANSKSTFGGTGFYASGWTNKYEGGRVSKQGTIYNEHAGLPHLLENGHANRGGGRTAGRPHIKPVEDEVFQAIMRAENDIP